MKDDDYEYRLDGGVGDCLYVYEDRVVIQHKSLASIIANGLKGDKTIYYVDMSSFQYKKPGLSQGYIQFSIAGGRESRRGVSDAFYDENSVRIIPMKRKQANEVADYISERIREVKTQSRGPIVKQLSPADEIIKYKQLFDAGVISKEEFEAKKRQLLNL